MNRSPDVVWDLIDGLSVPAEVGTPKAVARWIWTWWLCRPVFTSRQMTAARADAEAQPDDSTPVASLLDRGVITPAQVTTFADALERAVADELSSKGYSTLNLAPLPLQRIVSQVLHDDAQVRMTLDGLVMWVFASGRVKVRSSLSDGWDRTVWPEHLAALDRRWRAAANRAAAWTAAFHGARDGQEWEWKGTHYLLALTLYVLSHQDDLLPERVSPDRAVEMLTDDALERIGRPLLTRLGHPLSRSFDDPPSMAWSWLTRTWPEPEGEENAMRWGWLSRRPETLQVDTPAWIVCAAWAVAAARQAT